MSKISKMKLNSLLADDKESVNPIAFPNETFTLFSIPSYDTGEPETVSGSDIGSSKVLLRDQDILLSRIVPHIRRCWIVNGTQKHRKIGSGEWIVFRPSKDVYPKYLRYFFLTETFGKKFLQTVRGVGGSLLRADPKQVGEFEIPVPQLPIQKKITAILDKADTLRQKDKQLLEYYNQLAESIFYDMFGDPVRNEKGWDKFRLGQVCTQITDGTHFSPPSVDYGVPYITAKHLKSYGLDFDSDPTYVSQQEHQKIFGRCKPEMGDVLYIKDGATTGIAAINHYDFEFSMLSSLALIKPNKSMINNYFLNYWLNNKLVKENLVRNYMAGAAIKRFTLAKINLFDIPVPPLKLQDQFMRKVTNIESSVGKIDEGIQNSEALFQSLLQKAFKGELVKEP
jgi:type I restriction enzyme, S subunit